MLQTYIQKVNKLEELCSNSDTSQTYIQKVNKLEAQIQIPLRRTYRKSISWRNDAQIRYLSKVKLSWRNDAQIRYLSTYIQKIQKVNKLEERCSNQIPLDVHTESQ